VIDHVAEDELFCKHHSPRDVWATRATSRCRSSWRDGTFYGTLCAIDPKPRESSGNPTVIGMFRLFAELIRVSS